MSISFPATDSISTLERLRAQRVTGAKRVTSQRRIEANRRNCRKSTGPRTIEGKRRASRNALKHGICRTLSFLPSECEPTFFTFVAELEEELRPATALQRLVFNQIASLTWRLERLPEAQTKLFAEEMGKVPCDDGEELKASDVLARRFSDEPASNGFALMERYERGMRNQLLRLFRQYDQLQKQRPTTPYDPSEPPAPPERAWRAIDEEEKQRRIAEKPRQEQEQKPDWSQLRQEHLRREAEEEARETSSTAAPSASAGPRGSNIGTVDGETAARPGAGALGRRGEVQSGDDPAERSQSKPIENPVSAQPAGKCSIGDDAPVTKRSQRDGPVIASTDDARRPPPRMASQPPLSIISRAPHEG